MALNLTAGDFKKIVHFKAPVLIKENGGTEKTYPSITITTWAAEKSVDQRRVIEAGGTALVDTRFFYIRYAASRSIIDKDWLIEIDGVDYTIHSKPTVQESGLKVFEIIAKGKHG